MDGHSRHRAKPARREKRAGVGITRAARIGCPSGEAACSRKVNTTRQTSITLEEARQAACRTGIDMRMFELRFEPGPYYGYISQTGSGSLLRGQSGRILLTLQEAGLANEREAVETIAHELNHIRAILKIGTISSEVRAEAAAKQAGRYFRR